MSLDDQNQQIALCSIPANEIVDANEINYLKVLVEHKGMRCISAVVSVGLLLALAASTAAKEQQPADKGACICPAVAPLEGSIRQQVCHYVCSISPL